MGEILIYFLVLLVCGEIATHQNRLVKKKIWKKAANGKLYMINRKSLPWSDANNECEIRSGKLITITDDHTQGILKHIINEGRPDKYWIGLVEDLFRHWTWEGGEGNPKYLNWEEGQPTQETTAGCALLGYHGYWQASDCEVPRKSICQKDDDGLLEDDYPENNSQEDTDGDERVGVVHTIKVEKAGKNSTSSRTTGNSDRDKVTVAEEGLTERKSHVNISRIHDINSTSITNASHKVENTTTQLHKQRTRHARNHTADDTPTAKPNYNYVSKNTTVLTVLKRISNSSSGIYNITSYNNQSSKNSNQSMIIDSTSKKKTVRLRHNNYNSKMAPSAKIKTNTKNNDYTLRDWLTDFRTYRIQNVSDDIGEVFKKDFSPTISEATSRSIISPKLHSSNQTASASEENKELTKKDNLCDTPNGYRYRNKLCDLNYEAFEKSQNSQVNNKDQHDHGGNPQDTTSVGNKKHIKTDHSDNTDIDEVLEAVLEREGVSEADQRLILGNSPTTKELTPSMMQTPKVSIDETSSLNEAENQILGVKNVPTPHHSTPHHKTTSLKKLFATKTSHIRTNHTSDGNNIEEKYNSSKTNQTIEVGEGRINESKLNEINITSAPTNPSIKHNATAIQQLKNNQGINMTLTANTTKHELENDVFSIDSVNNKTESNETQSANSTFIQRSIDKSTQETQTLQNATDVRRNTTSSAANVTLFDADHANDDATKTKLQNATHALTNTETNFATNGHINYIDAQDHESPHKSTHSYLRMTVSTFGGNAKGAVCVFPFVYEEDTYNECIPSLHKGLNWCATTSNYDKMPLWGYCCHGNEPCDDPSPKPEHQIRPLIRLSQKLKNETRLEKKNNMVLQRNLPSVKSLSVGLVNIRTLQNASLLQKTSLLQNAATARVRGARLSTTSRILHVEGEEMLSVHSGLKTYGGNALGARCVIPFVYDGRTHEKCIPRDDGSSWCSATHNYDKTPLWGTCCDKKHCQDLY